MPSNVADATWLRGGPGISLSKAIHGTHLSDVMQAYKVYRTLVWISICSLHGNPASLPALTGHKLGLIVNSLYRACPSSQTLQHN